MRTATNQRLFPSGIRGTPDSDPSYTYSACVACHQISRDGFDSNAPSQQKIYVFDRAPDRSVNLMRSYVFLPKQGYANLEQDAAALRSVQPSMLMNFPIECAIRWSRGEAAGQFVARVRPEHCSFQGVAFKQRISPEMTYVIDRDSFSIEDVLYGENGQPLFPRTGLLRAAAHDLRRHLETAHRSDAEHPRTVALIAQLTAMEARAEQLSGARLTWPDETARLIGDLPDWPADGSADANALRALDRLLPGRGPLPARFAAFEEHFAVPPDRLSAVLNRALTLCREATLTHVVLPPDEHLEVEYVPGASWSGFSRYQGHGRSIMQVNTGLPLSVDRVLDLACHEGYPGHHAINTLRDHALAQGRGWIEAAAMLTFSPTSYALEGLASAAPRLAFSDSERIRIVRDELIPLAGLQPAGAEAHVRANLWLAALDGVTAAATREYLTGAIDRIEAAERLRRRAAMEHPEATLAFIDEYRSLATAYTAGRTRAWRLVGPEAPLDLRWQRYMTLALAGRLSATDGVAAASVRISRATTN